MFPSGKKGGGGGGGEEIWTAFAIGLSIVYYFIDGILSFDVYTRKEGGAPGMKQGAAHTLGETLQVSVTTWGVTTRNSYLL